MINVAVGENIAELRLRVNPCGDVCDLNRAGQGQMSCHDTDSRSGIRVLSSPASRTPAMSVEGPLRLCELDGRYRRGLQKFFRSRGCAVAVAQDLTQDVFLRVVAYQRSREIANGRTFVFQTAVNLLRDTARARKRWNVEPLEQAGAGEQGPIDLITPERIVESRQDVHVVRAALAALDARTQRIFLMNRIDQLRHRTIADRLGVSVSLIEKALRGARRHLESKYRSERVNVATLPVGRRASEARALHAASWREARP
jgi:RNA polymerase sigma-70 factor (ECF subfamily)